MVKVTPQSYVIWKINKIELFNNIVSGWDCVGFGTPFYIEWIKWVYIIFIANMFIRICFYSKRH